MKSNTHRLLDNPSCNTLALKMVGVSSPAPPGSKSIEDERPKKLLSLVQFAVNICQSDCDLKSLLCVKGNGYRNPHFPFRVSALLFLHLLSVTEKAG